MSDAPTLEHLVAQAETLPRPAWRGMACDGVFPAWGTSERRTTCDGCAAVSVEFRHLYIAPRWTGAAGPKKGLGSFCQGCCSRLNEMLESKRP